MPPSNTHVMPITNPLTNPAHHSNPKSHHGSDNYPHWFFWFLFEPGCQTPDSSPDKSPANTADSYANQPVIQSRSDVPAERHIRVTFSHTSTKGLTPGITRRARNADSGQVSRMKAALFAVGCMPLLGADRSLRTTDASSHREFNYLSPYVLAPPDSILRPPH